jgi:hypothetical protein
MQDDETIKVERFEFLDRYSGNGVKSDTNDLIDWAYLVHGYNEKKKKEIFELIDSVFCSQILPGLPSRMGQTYVTFYKASSNTNRENFNKGRIKHKIIRSKSNDKLAFYLVTRSDSRLLLLRQNLNKSGMLPNPPPVRIKCE